MARMNMAELDTLENGMPDGGADALYQLGLKYSSGKGVDADLITAHKWFNLAALRGNREARDYRTELAQEMSGNDVAEAQRQAREWLRCH